MTHNRSEYRCSDSHVMSFFSWKTAAEPKAVVLILHGMAEHASRYCRFAAFLNGNGYSVYAPDHRGHGSSAAVNELGWFAHSDGWNRVVADVREFTENVIRKDYPEKKIFLFGHSMGSFMARSAVAVCPRLFSGAVFSGTGTISPAVRMFGQMLAAFEVKTRGEMHPSALLDRLSFGSYNKPFEKEGEFGWLSRDRSEVKKYIDDPLCGFICTAGFFRDFLAGVGHACSPAAARSVPADLPILLISGSDDPVGGFGRGVEKACMLYRRAGVRDVTLVIEEGARHELLNDTSRDRVHETVLGWLDARNAGV